jgi:hypothetical protein
LEIVFSILPVFICAYASEFSISSQLCFRIHHQERSRKLGRTEIERGISDGVNLIRGNISSIKRNNLIQTLDEIDIEVNGGEIYCMFMSCRYNAAKSNVTIINKSLKM